MGLQTSWVWLAADREFVRLCRLPYNRVRPVLASQYNTVVHRVYVWVGVAATGTHRDPRPSVTALLHNEGGQPGSYVGGRHCLPVG